MNSDAIKQRIAEHFLRGGLIAGVELDVKGLYSSAVNFELWRMWNAGVNVVHLVENSTSEDDLYRWMRHLQKEMPAFNFYAHTMRAPTPLRSPASRKLTMPKTDPQAFIVAAAVKPIMAAARARGPRTFALTAWTYEFGARAAEPGQQLLRDVDLVSGLARPMHLKNGTQKSWQPLLGFCLEAMPLWMMERATTPLTAIQRPFLFPSGQGGTCYTCKGTGARAVLKRDKKIRYEGAEKVECHHCGGTGKRGGMSRIEVYTIIHEVLKAAGMPKDRRHPHVLRHSIITHLLDGGVSPKVIQARVGHKDVQTTLGYAGTTDAAKDELTAALGKVYG